MINTLLMNFGERTAYAGRMLLIGMGTIFLSLAILWGVMEIFRRLVVGGSQTEEKKPTAPAPAPVARTESVAVTSPAPVAAPASNDALIAAITAAVAAALADENGGVVPGFRVVSFKKVTTVSKRK
jgi:Na+-transporting methylmalonyl-CoA/oxaloacetate decarboxylase gamma subunit